VLALRPAQPGDILLEPDFGHSAISAIDTTTCSGTVISPGSRSGWARRLVFW
jgi:hypothetical protein